MLLLVQQFISSVLFDLKMVAYITLSSVHNELKIADFVHYTVVYNNVPAIKHQQTSQVYVLSSKWQFMYVYTLGLS